jgi:hypothetical protein
MKRSVFSWWLALVALAWCAGLPASAEERLGRVKGSAKDPVETAFELPQGTRLTARQAKSLDKMRQDYEPQLRDALEKMNSAPDAKTKRTDAKDALRIRQTIRGEIDQILNSAGGYEGSQAAPPVSYESRYPTSGGVGVAPSGYYAPYVYPSYPYPYYPGTYYPYYSRPYYGSGTSTANNTSQNKPTYTNRPATQASTSRPPNASSGGARPTTQAKH